MMLIYYEGWAEKNYDVPKARPDIQIQVALTILTTISAYCSFS
jgi:hypothetical protein